MKSFSRVISLVLAVVLLCGSLPMTAFAKGDIIYGVAFITGSSVRLRSDASTDSRILDTTNKNEVVVVLSKHGDWYKVIYDLKEGYMHGDYLDVAKTENAELGYGRINGSSVNLRSGAGTSHSRVAQGDQGDKAYIIGIKDGWYKVIFEDDICYIRSDYLDLTEAPYENKSSSKSPKFYRGGKSLGTEPSASALNGASSDKEEPKEEVKEEPKEETTTTPSTPASGTTASTTAKDIKYGIGFTTGSGLRLRSTASTGGTIIDSANKNEAVVVLAKTGDWYKVIYDLQEGYMHGDYLKVSTTENAELGYGRVNTTKVNLRSGPGASHGVVDTASKGEKAYIIGINNGWYKVIYGQHVCYVRSDYLDLTETPYENRSSAKSPKFYRGGKSLGVEPSASALNGSTSSSKPSTTAKVTGDQIVSTAKQYLGVPYKYGGTTPSGFDCSGFVYYVYRSLGINVSRTQATMYSQGTPVKKSELKPGDLVFFQNTYKAGISHVGIYVGDGKFIHSPQSGKVVSYADLNSDYYTSHYYGAARYTG